MRTTSSFLRVLVPVFVLALPLVARADGGDRDPRVTRILQAKKTLHWNQPLGNSKDRYGHAETVVAAPADVVAKTAAEFGQYKSLHRKFSSARVVAKEGDKTDVYMRYPVRIGGLTIEIAATMRFSPTRTEGSAFVLEAHVVRGDLKYGHTVIRIEPVDAKHSLLVVDVLLAPKLPAPQSFIDEELRDGALDFANGLKDKSQGWVGPVTQL